MILCWDKLQGSPIHDHSNSHCLLRVLEGELHEELYDWPADEVMQLKKETGVTKDQVAYMHDKIGL
jgi:cysteine dioxygenase